MSSRRQHTAALIATLLLHGGVIVVLMLLYLRYTPSDTAERTWPPVDSSEVLFGGEYVMVGDGAVEPSEEPAPAEATDISEVTDMPETAEPVRSTPPQTDTPKPTHNPTATAPKPAAPLAQETAQEAAQDAARAAIASRVNFGRGASGTDGGKPGQKDGNAVTGATSGQPGFSLNGRTIASWETPKAGPVGTITISVTVDRQGRVTDATYRSGTGAAAANTAARESCVRAARASRFSIDLNAPAVQKGTITYHFK